MKGHLNLALQFCVVFSLTGVATGAPGTFSQVAKQRHRWIAKKNLAIKGGYNTQKALADEILFDVLRQLNELRSWEIATATSTEQMVAAFSLVPVQLEILQSLVNTRRDKALHAKVNLACSYWKSGWRQDRPKSVSLKSVRKWALGMQRCIPDVQNALQ